jgi:hypothetical protein
MSIGEAIRAVNNEPEQHQMVNNPVFRRAAMPVLQRDYDEIDEELPNYILKLSKVLDLIPYYSNKVIDSNVYLLAKMMLHFGMRVQRKLDRPDEPTTVFWRGRAGEEPIH